jgi:hypothetical protein
VCFRGLAAVFRFLGFCNPAEVLVSSKLLRIFEALLVLST